MLMVFKKIFHIINHIGLKVTITYRVTSNNSHFSYKKCLQSFKAFWIFLLFLLIFFFFFLSIIKDIMHGHIGDRKEITLLRIVCVCIYIYIYFKYLVLSCCASATPYRVRLLWFAHKCSWLVCNNGEMVIYAFLLGFSILTIKIYDIKIKIVCLKTINNTHN